MQRVRIDQWSQRGVGSNETGWTSGDNCIWLFCSVGGASWRHKKRWVDNSVMCGVEVVS